jgi:hypothetical protein
VASDPFFPEVYQRRSILIPSDVLVLGVDTAVIRLEETLRDLTEEEYHWEPLSENERLADKVLSAETKRVWRIYESDGHYHYDYGERSPDNPAFTTIAWIMNHIATTADMYLRCIKTGKPAGEGFSWDDLPIQATLPDMHAYLFQTLENTRDYLLTIEQQKLNAPTPAPWGLIRPAFLNIWGGIIEHALQHNMQIAVRKERIRMRF